MPAQIGWSDIAIRLLLTVVAGGLIGFNRREHGRPAGLRTTLLVCLAASISMIQVNLLLAMRGKVSDSYVVMDLMRLPLGILSGMGFIGAGTILRKDNMVSGITTAATLWFSTVVGLCLGGGQLGLGIVATILGFAILETLRPLERSWKQDRQASLTVIVGKNGPTEQDVTQMVTSAGYKVSALSVTFVESGALREMNFRINWRAHADDIQPPSFVKGLAATDAAIKVAWQP